MRFLWGWCFLVGSTRCVLSCLQGQQLDRLIAGGPQRTHPQRWRASHQIKTSKCQAPGVWTETRKNVPTHLMPKFKTTEVGKIINKVKSLKTWLVKCSLVSVIKWVKLKVVEKSLHGKKTKYWVREFSVYSSNIKSKINTGLLINRHDEHKTRQCVNFPNSHDC